MCINMNNETDASMRNFKTIERCITVYILNFLIVFMASGDLRGERELKERELK